MQRTVAVQLNPTPEQARALKDTLEQHTACFNVVASEGFTTGCHNGVELHKRTYYPLRAQYPDLPAQLVCAARVKATEAVTSALTWKTRKQKAYPAQVERASKQGKPIPPFKPVRCPHSEIAAIRYDARSFWVKWDSLTCSLATVAGRVELPFTVPVHLMPYVGHKTCSADLCYRNGRYTLHIVVSLPAPSVSPSQEVAGVDLGLNRPAVTSTRHFLGERRWKEQERRTFRLKRKLQAKGSRSAKRHLKKLSGKQFRRRKDHDHVLSKRIVANTPQARPSPGKTSRTFERQARWDAANREVRSVTTSDACTVGPLRNCTRLWSIKQRRVVSVWSKWTRAIPRKRARSVVFNIAPIAALKVSSSVGSVATPSMPISMPAPTFDRNISRLLPTSVHLCWWIPVNVPIVSRLRA